MNIEIRKDPFDPYEEISRYQQQIKQEGKYGATACFIGTMRDFNEGEQVDAMKLEHYPGMTEKHLEDICNEAQKRWDVIDILMLHRVGKINIGDPIVLVAVWSVHRAAAFDASRFMMEDLKSKAPFWKQESIAGSKRWVERNTPG
jgi:molybdopterin synthase catalytic subunit